MLWHKQWQQGNVVMYVLIILNTYSLTAMLVDEQTWFLLHQGWIPQTCSRGLAWRTSPSLPSMGLLVPPFIYLKISAIHKSQLLKEYIILYSGQCTHTRCLRDLILLRLFYRVTRSCWSGSAISLQLRLRDSKYRWMAPIQYQKYILKWYRNQPRLYVHL